MSIRLMAAAWELDLPQTEKMVLLCLCDHANDDGTCWPSVARLARKCSVSDRTVQKAIKGLCERQIIATTDTPGRPHMFAIDPRRLFTPEDSSPPKKTTKPPKILHPTPEDSSDEPSKNHQEPSIDCASDDALKPEHVVDEWNNVAARIWNGRTVRDLTPSRRQLVKARIAQYTIDDFVTVFGKIEASPFLRGERNWNGATFDWTLKRANFQKIIEGNYDD